MSTSTITFQNSFSDGTTRNLEIGPFNSSKINLSAIKSAVKSLNADPSTIASLYLSKNGANFTEISQVKITTANSVVII